MNKIYKVKEIEEMLHPIFAALPVHKAILFGSYAKGEATENSDVDIVIDSQKQLLNIRFYELLENIVMTLNKQVDLFEISEVQNSPILRDIDSTGVILYEQ
jgi:predicted nucleotidyltransferase